jgi:hypothetical protein
LEKVMLRGRNEQCKRFVEDHSRKPFTVKDAKEGNGPRMSMDGPRLPS